MKNQVLFCAIICLWSSILSVDSRACDGGMKLWNNAKIQLVNPKIPNNVPKPEMDVRLESKGSLISMNILPLISFYSLFYFESGWRTRTLGDARGTKHHLLLEGFINNEKLDNLIITKQNRSEKKSNSERRPSSSR